VANAFPVHIATVDDLFYKQPVFSPSGQSTRSPERGDPARVALEENNQRWCMRPCLRRVKGVCTVQWHGLDWTVTRHQLPVMTPRVALGGFDVCYLISVDSAHRVCRVRNMLHGVSPQRQNEKSWSWRLRMEDALYLSCPSENSNRRNDSGTVSRLRSREQINAFQLPMEKQYGDVSATWCRHGTSRRPLPARTLVLKNRGPQVPKMSMSL
jgi:hypothetical protein